MEDFAIFPNAPITEALLDIKVVLPKEVDLIALEKIHSIIKERFPERGQSVQATVELKEGSAKQQALNTTGYLFRSPSEKKIFQARLDGFTFNKLKPYEKWESFRDEARELWELYTKFTNPISISRIALRYINRIELPLPFESFQNYISIIPNLPKTLPSKVSHFFMQLAIPHPEISATAVISETIEKPTETVLPLILDIDVYCQKNYAINSPVLWEDFEKLRLFKDKIFFDSLTDKTKELFK